MGTKDKHLEAYKLIKADLQTPSLSAITLTECYFLAALNLIDACAARHRTHIGKHRMVAAELERNPEILGEKTKKAVDAFLRLERVARPKLVYGFSGTEEDLLKARKDFETIERICLEALEG